MATSVAGESACAGANNQDVDLPRGERRLYLEEITHAGKTSRPRIAISRSAIVRLALERLAATMTTDDIVDQLRKTGDEHQGKGRKRR
ncbi:hypothetical protein GCM10022204_23050 [Microlunatus aurantiacus]|uniref:Uncharacterized protein n=1 Tax=Microlunatus aurantiacus TaxID=446786 RepID=A0ABP7DIA9_9ACTN